MTNFSNSTLYQLNNNYSLQNIAGIPYLLPYGQAIVEFRRGIQLNETSEFMLQALKHPLSAEMLCSILMNQYKAIEKERPAIEKDVSDFLLQMETQHIIKKVSTDWQPEQAAYDFQIGTLKLRMQIPQTYIEPSFWDFSCEITTIPDILLRYIPKQPPADEKCVPFIHTSELTILQSKSNYVFRFEESYGITEMHVSIDGSIADFYCPLPHPEAFTDNLFHAIRFAYLIRAQQAGLFAIHSASICYHDKAWLFSAPSGTGKSTHTALWKKLFPEVTDVNGDLNLLGFQDGIPTVYGIPWCGTSGIYTTKSVPLGGIVFLRQALSDRLSQLPDSQRILHIADRLISPTWTEEQVSTNLNFAAKLAPEILTYALQCTKENSAAFLIKEAIDQKLSYERI